jgi:glycosyltransferase involved in cell wall biosynthesis
LDALKKQTRPANEVLLVVRDTDVETRNFLETFDPNPLPLQIVTVTTSGVIAALNKGLDAAQGDIIAITDDDAAPRPEWLTRIEAHFVSDDAIGGVGGRDWMYQGTELVDGACEVVGKVQWFGRTIGNHHFGVGKPREVEILKGANMSYRRSAIANLRFDERLRGTGAQAHNDLAFGLAVKGSGWKLIYDPLVELDHFHGQRFDEDIRYQFNPIATGNQVHNYTLILLEYLPPIRRLVFILWAILIGTRGERGLLQTLRFIPAEGILSLKQLLVSLQGRWQGYQTWRQSTEK